MIWRNILIGGAAIALGNGLALNPDGQVSPMLSDDRAVSSNGGTEYVVPYPESGSGSSIYMRDSSGDQGDE